MPVILHSVELRGYFRLLNLFVNMERLIVEFTVRSDKFRGILIESISKNGSDWHYFRYHDQPLDRHCIQLQSIIRSENVKRSRKIVVNVINFYHEYVHPVDKTFQFKGTKLMSSVDQFVNSSNLTINKEIGQMKRASTIAQKKQQTIVEHNEKLKAKKAAEESAFQIERAKRIRELFGASNQPNQ